MKVGAKPEKITTEREKVGVKQKQSLRQATAEPRKNRGGAQKFGANPVNNAIERGESRSAREGFSEAR